jgi:hypothetical protein
MKILTMDTPTKVNLRPGSSGIFRSTFCIGATTVKRILFGLAATIVCSAALAVDPNTGVLNVRQIKANWAADGSTGIYYYIFDGWSSGNCTWVRSGDPNINEILMTSYLMGVSLKANIVANTCTIATVELQSS